MAIAKSQSRKNGFVGLTKTFNKVALTIAGSRIMPLYGVLIHRGRKSGKVFRTPVVVRGTQHGVIIPMPWGDTTDWYRNIVAAGGCGLRWKGKAYQLSEPQVLDAAQASASFSSVQRAGMSRFGIKKVLQMRATLAMG